MSSIDQQFVEYVVKSLVGKPDAVKIDRRIDEKGVLLELTVDPEDLGRVIGKHGATAQSIRTLLRALGTKNDARYNLKIVDNGIPYEQRTNNNNNYSSSEQSDVHSNEDQEKDTKKSDDIDDSEDIETTLPKDDDDRFSKTRRELADMDDLDL